MTLKNAWVLQRTTGVGSRAESHALNARATELDQHLCGRHVAPLAGRVKRGNES